MATLMRKQRWIGRAIKRPGALSQQLGIPEERNIPTTLLRAIRRAPLGSTLQNPTRVGKREIPVTRLLKQRAGLALTLRSV
ncbi:hypothetical protein KKH23_10565 [Patescibacteria group bacterium]|nr:hypothetical protein [Patescibacteria group bacterium]